MIRQENLIPQNSVTRGLDKVFYATNALYIYLETLENWRQMLLHGNSDGDNILHILC